MRLALGFGVLLAATLWMCAEGAETQDDPRCVYEANPNHLWNRLHQTLFVRTDRDGKKWGYDTLDPYFWGETTHLLKGESHQAAIRVLNEFLKTSAPEQINDPVKKAILQRDLWALFDWLADRTQFTSPENFEKERRVLRKPLAEAIRRLALTEAQIAQLPDNYSAAVASKIFPEKHDTENPTAFLPPNLFKGRDWLKIGINASEVVAPAHVQSFGGRSVFLVVMRRPDGQKETIKYLGQLRNFLAACATNSTPSNPLNLEKQLFDAPQFPVGTTLALVRRAVLIDDTGTMRASPLCESVQIRVYRIINRMGKGSQDFCEFKLSRRKLFDRKAGGLVPAALEEKEFVQFLAHTVDPFESESVPTEAMRAVTLNTCIGCHPGGGIQSMLSFSRKFGSPTRPAELMNTSMERESDRTIEWKKKRANWGLLQGFWEAASGVPESTPP
jgi:hypothetical protein